MENPSFRHVMPNSRMSGESGSMGGSSSLAFLESSSRESEAETLIFRFNET